MIAGNITLYRLCQPEENWPQQQILKVNLREAELEQRNVQVIFAGTNLPPYYKSSPSGTSRRCVNHGISTSLTQIFYNQRLSFFNVKRQQNTVRGS